MDFRYQDQGKWPQYHQLIDKITTRRSQVDRMLDVLHNKTNWFEAPASRHFHLPIEGGLVQHSVHVTENLLRFKNLLAPEISDESCVITGLFHDLGKVGMPEEPYYLTNNGPTKEQHPFFLNTGLRVMGNGMRSLLWAAKYLDLTDEEAQAIAYAEGQYSVENRVVARCECKLALLVQYADSWAIAEETT